MKPCPCCGEPNAVADIIAQRLAPIIEHALAEMAQTAQPQQPAQQPANNSPPKNLDLRKPPQHSIGRTPATSTFTSNRSHVGTIKRPSGELARLDLQAHAEDVRDALRQFVGPEDFAANLGLPKYRFLFEDPAYRAALIKEYNFLASGVRSGEIKIQTTPGRALWSYLKHAIAKINAHRKAA